MTQGCKDVAGPRRGVKAALAGYNALQRKAYRDCICLSLRASKDMSLPVRHMASAVYNLGRCYELLGCRAEAVEFYQRAVGSSSYGRPGWKTRCEACVRLGGHCVRCTGKARPKRTWPMPFGLWVGMTRDQAKLELRKQQLRVTARSAVSLTIDAKTLLGRKIPGAELVFDAAALKYVAITIWKGQGGDPQAWIALVKKTYRTTWQQDDSPASDRSVLIGTVNNVEIQIDADENDGTLSFGRARRGY